ncbi:glycosyltransferase family 2 protein [Gramella sp. BOM4]|nr:glycosyltransferase family 2 protein [Christiangramia bathymodioli]
MAENKTLYNQNFQVSVIIPVYKAEKYLRKAVESAIHLVEVGEIILIEDKSPDDALIVCNDLEREYEKVKLYRHPNEENKGAGASRNLGIEKSSCEFISFLDADDWYKSNRFEKTKILFKDPGVDGVYEPVGTWFYEQEGALFGKKITKEKGDQIITFLKNPVEPENLFYSLMSQSNGNFHTNGITIRRSLIDKAGFFSTELKLHQDTEYWIRCAYYGTLIAPKDPDVVAIRGVHDENRINSVNFYSKAKFYKSLFRRFRNKPMSLKEKLLLYKKGIFFNPDRKFHQGPASKKYPEIVKLFWKRIIT